MGIEPTQSGISALLTVLKTAEPTRTLPPPRHLLSREIFQSDIDVSETGKPLQPLCGNENYYTLFGAFHKDRSRQKSKKWRNGMNDPQPRRRRLKKT
jgi:hypothetical protein